jgi:hypothetical protein
MIPSGRFPVKFTRDHDNPGLEAEIAAGDSKLPRLSGAFFYFQSRAMNPCGFRGSGASYSSMTKKPHEPNPARKTAARAPSAKVLARRQLVRNAIAIARAQKARKKK